MYNLYFPICAFMISLLISLAFFSKKRMFNKETNCYSKLILLSLLESSLAIVIVVMAIIFGTLPIAYLTNRIDYVLIVLWVSQMFKYFVYITTNDEKIINIVRKVVNIINVIITLLIFSTDITLINENGIIDTVGTSTTIVTVSCILYLASIIITFIISLRNKRKLGNKILPMVFLIILFVLMVIIRSIMPEIVLISFIISYINLIMFFTIENPDTKLIEEIIKSKEHADNYNAEKTYFIYNMTQEIKQPVTKSTSLIKELMNKVDKEDIKDDLRVIEENMISLNGIINNVLDISSIDSSKIKTMNSKYNIELLLKEIIVSTKNKLKDTGIDFITEIDKNLPERLYGDSTRIKQVINTILSNSIKYTKKGFIELNIRSVIKNDVCRLMIKIEDSGEGINVDKLDAVFNKNKNENEVNLINENDSSELNLVNVRKILNIMGGTILINSAVNSGTKITIVLDQIIVESENKNIEKIVDDYKNDYQNKKILIIDDNENSIKLLIKLFQNYKIKVTSAKTIKSCLDCVKNNNYDLIFLSDTIEENKNIDILNKIKKIAKNNINIIAISKNSAILYKEDYLNLGFVDFLEKPIKKEELDKILKKYF